MTNKILANPINKKLNQPEGKNKTIGKKEESIKIKKDEKITFLKNIFIENNFKYLFMIISL